MMGRLLCWLGLHKWPPYPSRFVFPDEHGQPTYYPGYRFCLRCNRRDR